MSRPRISRSVWSALLPTLAFAVTLVLPLVARADEGPSLADRLTTALASGGMVVATLIAFVGIATIRSAIV